MPGLSSYGDAIIQFCNCRILQNHNIAIEDLWVQNGKILDPEQLFFDRKVRPAVKIDCRNKIIAPGLIEVQING